MHIPSRSSSRIAAMHDTALLACRRPQTHLSSRHKVWLEYCGSREYLVYMLVSSCQFHISLVSMAFADALHSAIECCQSKLTRPVRHSRGPSKAVRVSIGSNGRRFYCCCCHVGRVNQCWLSANLQKARRDKLKARSDLLCSLICWQQPHAIQLDQAFTYPGKYLWY